MLPCVLGWLISKCHRTSKDEQKLEHLSSAGGLLNGTVVIETVMVASPKVKNGIIYGNTICGYISTGTEINI